MSSEDLKGFKNLSDLYVGKIARKLLRNLRVKRDILDQTTTPEQRKRDYGISRK
jgi:hypothetical protein